MADHPEFTRLVFEFDVPADYGIEHEPGSRALVVNLTATGSAQLLRSWGPWVKEAVVEPLLDVALVHVALRDPGVQVIEERLEAPPRIVLDVRQAPPALSSNSAPVEAVPVQDERVADTAERATPAVPAEPPVPVDPVPALPDEGPRPEAPLLSRELPPDVDPERTHDPESIAAQLTDAERLPVASPPAPANRERFPVAQGLLAALLLAGVVLGVFAWRSGGLGWYARRIEKVRTGSSASGSRSEARPAELPASPPTKVPEGLAVEADEAPSEMTEETMLDPPLESPPPPFSERSRSVSSGLPGDALDDSRLEALSRRVEALEFALERALQGRERLEAQVVAQAEELRVQRAALARTQRAVRSLSRGGDPRSRDHVLRD